MACQEKPLEMIETIYRRTVTSEIVTGFRLPCFVRFYFTVWTTAFSGVFGLLGNRYAVNDDIGGKKR